MRKLAIAFGTCVGLLARVKLSVPLQVSQTTKPDVAGLTQIRSLLVVRQKVALQIVVTRKLSVTIRALVLLARRLGRLSVVWKAVMPI